MHIHKLLFRIRRLLRTAGQTPGALSPATTRRGSTTNAGGRAKPARIDPEGSPQTCSICCSELRSRCPGVGRAPRLQGARPDTSGAGGGPSHSNFGQACQRQRGDRGAGRAGGGREGPGGRVASKTAGLHSIGSQNWIESVPTSAATGPNLVDPKAQVGRVGRSRRKFSFERSQTQRRGHSHESHSSAVASRKSGIYGSAPMACSLWLSTGQSITSGGSSPKLRPSLERRCVCDHGRSRGSLWEYQDFSPPPWNGQTWPRCLDGRVSVEKSQIQTCVCFF